MEIRAEKRTAYKQKYLTMKGYFMVACGVVFIMAGLTVYAFLR
jgi:hypothetical protein